MTGKTKGAKKKGGKKKGSAGGGDLRPPAPGPRIQASPGSDPPGEKQETPERSTRSAASENPPNVTEPQNSIPDDSDGRRENVQDKGKGIESSGQSDGGGGISEAVDEEISAPSPTQLPTDSSHNSIDKPDDKWEIVKNKKKDNPRAQLPTGSPNLNRTTAGAERPQNNGTNRFDSGGPPTRPRDRGAQPNALVGRNDSGKTPFQGSSGRYSHDGSGNERPSVMLYCNHFKVDFNPRDQIIYQYDVKFKHNSTTLDSSDQSVAESSNARTDEVGAHLKGLKRRILESIPDLTDSVQANGSGGKTCAYDGGSILYSIGETISQRTYEDVHLATSTDEPSSNSSGRGFVVTIDGEKALFPSSFPHDMTSHGEPQDKPILMALSILLHNCSAKADRLRVGQNSYYSKEEEVAFPDNRILKSWKGFHSSFRLSYERADSAKPRLMLNFSDTMTTVLNPSNKIITSKHITEFVEGQISDRSFNMIASVYNNQIDDSLRKQITDILSGVRVEHKGRKYTIRELHSKDSAETEFEYKKDPKKDKLSDTSVQSYFESKHQILLKYPNAPLLRMHGQKAVYIPFEVCKIVKGQRYTKLTSQQRSEFINFSRRNPTDKRRRIESVSPEIKRPSRKNS